MSEKPRHPEYWFYHEYLDEERRMRVHKHTSDTENDARRLHRQACEFRWVTHHVEPTVSALYRLGDKRDLAIAPGRRPGQPYGGQEKPIVMPDYIREKLKGFGLGDEAALSGVRATDDWNPVLPPPTPARTSASKDSFDTPF
jgi:hypothetical protein